MRVYVNKEPGSVDLLPLCKSLIVLLMYVMIVMCIKISFPLRSMRESGRLQVVDSDL